MRSILVLFLALPATLVFANETKEPEKETPPIERAFRGKVTKFKARRVALEYDFSREKVLEDFFEVNPFLAEPHGGFRLDDGVLVGEGLGALCHKGVFEADVTVSFTAKSRTPYDLGVTLLQPALTEQFLLFSVADTFFSIKDRQTPKQHMITVVGAKDGDGGPGETLFRYLNRSLKPTVKADDDGVSVEVLKRGNRNRLVVNKVSLDAEDRYGKFPEVQPALFVLNSELRVTKLRISGKLTEAWLKKHEVPWDPDEKDDEKGPEINPPRRDAGQDRGRDDRGTSGGGPGGWGSGGGSGAAALIRALADTSRSDEDRKKASEGLTTDNVRKDEFRSLIDCLYKDDLMTRTLAIQVLKRVTGKTLGYNPKAPEKSREKSIRLWMKYLRDNRDRFS